MKRLLLALSFVLFSLPSLAADCWPSSISAAPQFDCGQVVMYLNGSGLPVAVSPTTPQPIAPQAYPSGATPITGSVTGTTGAVSATLAAAVGKTTYICGYQVQANATAATSIPNASITGAMGGTLPFIEAVAAVPAVATTAQVFAPTCIPASAANTSIGVNAGAAGAGGNTTIYAWGYQQ